MADPVTTVLGGIVIAFVSGVGGAAIANKKKVNSDTCGERRKSCQELLLEKINNLDNKFDKIIKALENHNIIVI